jgi:hypothetical protein
VIRHASRVSSLEGPGKGMRMARAGFCRQCGSHVWLAEDGSCSHGHSADQISGAFDVQSQEGQSVSGASTPAPNAAPRHAPPPPSPYGPVPLSQGPEPSKRRTGLLVAVAIAVLGLIVVVYGGGFATVITLTNNASTRTSGAVCETNQTLVVIAAGDYWRRHERPPASLEDLVNEHDLDEMPVCLSGGTYVWNPAEGSISCTKHGSMRVPPSMRPQPRKTKSP